MLQFMKTENPAMAEIIERTISCSDYITHDRIDLSNQLTNTPLHRTKLSTYLEMNVDISIHPIYKATSAQTVIADNL